MGRSSHLFQAIDHATVKNGVAHADNRSANQIGIDRGGEIDFLAKGGLQSFCGLPRRVLAKRFGRDQCHFDTTTDFVKLLPRRPGDCPEAIQPTTPRQAFQEIQQGLRNPRADSQLE